MKTLLIIDANSLIHRAFHALPPLSDAAGVPTGALYGLSSMLLKVIRDLKPDYAVAAYDRREPTFRKQEYADYKIHRPKLADELAAQLDRSKDVFAAFHIPSFDSPGFEADDIIATLVERFKNSPELDKLIVLTGDLDSLQLVEEKRVVSWVPKKGITEFTEYNRGEVIARLGIPPELVPDYKGLVGDTSDNIPGVSGVGPKTAASVINTYGPLEDFYLLSPVPKNSALKKILESKEIALLSKKLATVRRDVPLSEVSLPDLSLASLNSEELVTFFDVMGFKNLSERVKSAGI